MTRHATFSLDGTRRWDLIRDWSDEITATSGTVNLIGLNPSKADAKRDDPTVRKGMGFARRWGYSRLVLTNLIPIVSTDPWGLPPWSGRDLANTEFLARWLNEAHLIVAAWGSQPKAVSRSIALEEHVFALVQMLPANKRLHCIGLTKAGAPLHPSRTKYTASPVLWERC